MNGKDTSFMYVARSRSGVGEGGRTTFRACLQRRESRVIRPCYLNKYDS